MRKTWCYTTFVFAALSLVLGVLFLQTVWAQPAGQNPDGIIQAFLDLIQTRQTPQAQALWTAESQQKFNFAKVPKEQFDIYQGVMLLLYATPATKVEVSPAQKQGEEIIVPVRKVLLLDQKFVLRQENGQWRIDLMRSAALSPPLSETLAGEQARETTRRTSRSTCQLKLKQLMLAIRMYAQDHNGILPPAATWCDAIWPYVKNRKVFVCPSAPDLACGYAYHDVYSEKKLADIRAPAQEVILYDSDTGEWNAHDAGTSLPPEGRHLGQAYVGYVDGHVKGLEVAQAQQLLKQGRGEQ